MHIDFDILCFVCNELMILFNYLCYKFQNVYKLPDSMAWPTHDPANFDIRWTSTNSDTVISWKAGLKKLNIFEKKTSEFGKNKKGKNGNTCSDDGVTYVDIGGTCDIDAVSVGAWFRGDDF